MIATTISIAEWAGIAAAAGVLALVLWLGNP